MCVFLVRSFRIYSAASDADSAVQLEIKGPASLITFANCSFGMSNAATSPAIAFTPHYWPAPSAPDHLLYGGLRVEDTCIQTDGELDTWLALVAPSGLADVHVEAVLVQEEWSPSTCARADVFRCARGFPPKEGRLHAKQSRLV